MNDNELYAKALVDDEYAPSVAGDGISLRAKIPEDYPDTFGYIDVDPFSKTKEGYEQAFALEDWLVFKQPDLWMRSFIQRPDPTTCSDKITHHQWRLGRIKWCFSQPEIAEALKCFY